MKKYRFFNILNISLIFFIIFFLVNPINAQTYFNPSIGYGGGYGLYGPTSWRTPVADFLAGYGISSYSTGVPYYPYGMYGYGGGYGLYGPTSWRTPVADFLAGYGISSYPMGSSYYGQPYYGIPYESPWDPYYSYQGYRHYYADPWIWEGESPPGWQPPPPPPPPPPPWYTPLYSPHDFSFEYLFRPYYGG